MVNLKSIRNFTFHGLNMTPASTFEEAIRQYEMDATYRKTPLFYEVEGEDGEMERKQSPYHKQIVRDDGVPIGVVGLRYKVVPYAEAFGPAEALCAGGAVIVGGGAPNNGERGYLVLDAPGTMQLGPNDPILNRFVLTSSHDGTGKIEVRSTPWRSLTGTTFAVDTKTKPMAFKHTPLVSGRVSHAKKVIARVNKNWGEFTKGVQRMIGHRLTEQEARMFIDAVLPPSGKEASTRLENIREDVFLIWRDTGIGTRLPYTKGTLFGLVQAFSEWADIKRTVRESKKRDEVAAALDAKLISDSARKKQRAFGLALYLAKNKKLSGALRRGR